MTSTDDAALTIEQRLERMLTHPRRRQRGQVPMDQVAIALQYQREYVPTFATFDADRVSDCSESLERMRHEKREAREGREMTWEDNLAATLRDEEARRHAATAKRLAQESAMLAQLKTPRDKWKMAVELKLCEFLGHAMAAATPTERLEFLATRVNSSGHTPLHRACRTRHAAMVALLLVYGADVTTRDNQGKTAFHVAVEHRAIEVFTGLRQHVLTYGDQGAALLLAADSDNNSILHWAAASGHAATLAREMVCKFLAAATLVAMAALQPGAQACTMIAAGRNATSDGSTLMAHTDDAGGGAADLRLVHVPAQDHPKGSKRAVYNFFGGYPRLVTKERGPIYAPKDDSEKTMTPLGFVPQVEHTYAYWDQDYGLMNEVQLSIAESTCGARTVGWPSDVPYGYNMFGIAELSKVALERCDSARCAVKTMGALAVEHGFFSEDSGDPARPGYMNSAESLGIADKYGEVWVFHVMTGKNNASAIWAAQRVPDDHVTVIANGFTIREMDLSNEDAFLASPNVTALAQEMGWWSPSMGPFDFTAAYGYRDKDPIRPLYVGRRVWRVFDVVAPSLQLDSRLGSPSDYPTYPFSVRPDTPVTVETIMNLLRDYYQGTPFDLSKGVGAGPFGAPIRWDGSAKNVTGGWERPISMFRTVYSFVLQSRGYLADAVGGVMWYGQGTPHGTVYVPFSCAQTEVPESYLLGKQSEFSQESAWWAFDFVNNWSLLRFDEISKDVRAKIAVLQTEAFALRKRIEQHVAGMNDTSAVASYVQTQSNDFASSVVARWWQFAWQLVAKFTDGYITTGENPEDMKTLGYPAWWLQAVEFSKWPGDSFTPRDDVRQEMNPQWTANLQGASQVHVSSAASSAGSDASSNGGFSILQVGSGLVCGVLIGAGAMYLHERRRHEGYRPIV
ncbi:hypothetical protein ATCC90586_006581 [Pythium insidiosum]|nr:hypothetical protein ATCC90586_006581 [Pythium insidiosum]